MRLNTETLASASARHPWRTLAAWLVLIVTMGAVSSKLLAGVLTDKVEFTSRPESMKAQALIDTNFGNGTKDTEFLVVTSPNDRTWDPAYPPFLERLRADVMRLGPDVVSGPVSTYVEAQAASARLFTKDGHGVLIVVRVAGDPTRVVSKLTKAVPAAAPEGYLATILAPEQLAQLAGGTAGTAGGTESSFGSGGSSETIALVSSPSTTVEMQGFPEAVRAVETAIARTAGSRLAAAPLSGFDARVQAASLVAGSRTTLVPVPLTEMSEDAIARLRTVAARATRNAGGAFYVQVAGQGALFADMMKLAEEDMRKSENIGLVFALIVLVVVFGSVVAAVLPIVMGLFAIAVALGLVALIGQVFEFQLFVQNMLTMVGLAVGIDYSLFIVSRYREERKKGFEKQEAIRRSGATANRAVFFSGTTVVLALLGMMIIPVSIFRSLAAGAILVTICAIGASMTLLPAILGLLGDRINWPRLSKRARLETSHDPKGGFWDRETRRVMARPVSFLLASVLVLGGLGAFYFQLHRGTSQSVSQLPPEFPSRQAFLTLVREFNAGGVTDPAKIVLTGDVGSPAAQAAIARLREMIASDPGFSKETTVTASDDGRVVMVSAYFRGDPSEDSAFQAIRDLRSTLIPRALGDTPELHALVGGNTASFTDFLHIADSYQWVVVPIVLALSFILLTIVFRSIIVPIKAIVMNLLSVAASYGAVTLVFQKGVGIGLFNDLGFSFKKVDAIEAWLPLLLFSILFGLSMDYHVFLLTRIREEYDKTGDNTEAVAYGLRTTAGIITGAALIMVAVFTAFAAGRLGQFQQMGFGLAVAVLIDATIVRTILVPSTMRLLGDLNWYLPGWLSWLPELHVEGGEPTTLTPFEVTAPRTRVEG